MKKLVIFKIFRLMFRNVTSVRILNDQIQSKSNFIYFLFFGSVFAKLNWCILNSVWKFCDPLKRFFSFKVKIPFLNYLIQIYFIFDQSWLLVQVVKINRLVTINILINFLANCFEQFHLKAEHCFNEQLRSHLIQITISHSTSNNV